ncbi:hypothetical protein ENBRE01_1324 [Enteropsectra breve]|nr:hypothetical protein ENBRE01_1324 [Enteropsectra breve]
MQLLTLFQFCAATTTFYDIATINQIVEDHNPKEPTETLECCICLYDCVRTSLDRAKEEDKLLLTDLLSCKNPKHQHFYHKNCLAEWIYAQDHKNKLKCPVCQEVSPIDVDSLVKEEIYLILTGKASFYPEFVDLYYGGLKRNIFTCLINKKNFATQESLKSSIEILEIIKSNLNEMSSWLDKLMSYESEHKDEALNDIKHLITVLKSPCHTFDALLEEVEKCVQEESRHEEKITILLLNFFSMNKPEEFVIKLQAHAGNSPQYWQILKIVLEKYKKVCFNLDKPEHLIDSLMCSEEYWDISENSTLLLEEFPLIDLLKKKITSSLAWITNEQRNLDITRSIRFCARHTDCKELKSFLWSMIFKCFTTEERSLENPQYIPKNQFMIDFIADYYSNHQPHDTVEEYPWFVYDFICAKILEEAPKLKSFYEDIFDKAAWDERYMINCDRDAKKHEYYFMNVLLDKDYISDSKSIAKMEKLVRFKDLRDISMLLRHCFYRDNGWPLFRIMIKGFEYCDTNEIYYELKQEEFLNYKNHTWIYNFAEVHHLCNIKGLWSIISDKQIDTFCKQLIQKNDYEQIKIMIFGCNNMNIIKMLNEEVVEKIISSSDFFTHLPIFTHFFEKENKSSLFVRHNFIQIFEMGVKKYTGVNSARVLLLLKQLNLIGFNGCNSFEKYKHIFKYLSQRSDAFYLLNTGRKGFSGKFNHDMAFYITKLLAQSHSFFGSKHAEPHNYEFCFDNWKTSVHKIAKDSFESWKLLCAYTWCDKLDKQDECCKEWNPYNELEISGTDIINKMEKYGSSSDSFTNELTSFIPRCVVNKIQEKIRIKSQK